VVVVVVVMVMVMVMVAEFFVYKLQRFDNFS
jgi:hypothetical protein